MRKLIAAFSFLFLSALMFGQTATVSGHVITGQNTASSSGISVLFELTNDGGQQCKVGGTGLVMPMTATFTQAQLAAGVSLLRNDQITCGTSLGSTRWRYTIKSGGTGTRQCSINVTGATNLDSTACLNATATPVTTTPTDSVYARIDGTNAGFTGDITHNGHNDTGIGTLGAVTGSFSGNETVGGTLGVTGRASLQNLNSIQFVNFLTPGTDWCTRAQFVDNTIFGGVKAGQMWVDGSAGTGCSIDWTTHNSIKWTDANSYSLRSLSVGAGGLSFDGTGYSNSGGAPFGTRLVYVGTADADMVIVKGTGGAHLDKEIFSRLILDGNNLARYTVHGEKVDAGTMQDMRFQGARVAGTYFQDAIDWGWFNVGWTFCQGNTGAGFCAIWDGGSGNLEVAKFQTEQGAASTNPQFVISGSVNTAYFHGGDFDSCTPFGGWTLIQGQDGANSAFPGATAGIGQGRPINIKVRDSFQNYCIGATAAAQGADNLVTDASAAQRPTKVSFSGIQNNAIAGPGQVAFKFDQATDVAVEDVISTGHTAGAATTVQMTANASLVHEKNVTSGDTNRFVTAGEVPLDDVQVSASNQTWTQSTGGRRLAAGTTALPSLTLSGTGTDTGTGWSNPGSTGYWRFSTQSNDDFLLSPTGPVLHNGFVYGLANGDSFSSTCATGIGWLAQGIVGVGNSCSSANKAGFIQSGNTVRVASDFTTANNTNLQTITGLSWTLPVVASNYSFHCSLLFSQATAAVADQFGIQVATNAPTNVAAVGEVFPSASTQTVGTLATLSTTTATAIVTFTPSATGTVFGGSIDGTFELPASANTINVMVQTSNGADAVTVKRGSYCQLL